MTSRSDSERRDRPLVVATVLWSAVVAGGQELIYEFDDEPDLLRETVVPTTQGLPRLRIGARIAVRRSPDQTDLVVAEMDAANDTPNSDPGRRTP